MNKYQDKVVQVVKPISYSGNRGLTRMTRDDKQVPNPPIGYGYYRVGKGDSLYKITSLPRVYNDGLKWPSLFWLNKNKYSLRAMKVSGYFEHEELPPGLELRFLTSDEVSDNLAERASRFWVVHPISTLVSENIVPTAIKIMKRGYQVYLSRFDLEGRKFFRCRIGFYYERSQAARVGQEIRPLLNLPKKPWVAKVTRAELNKYGGY